MWRQEPRRPVKYAAQEMRKAGGSPERALRGATRWANRRVTLALAASAAWCGAGLCSSLPAAGGTPVGRPVPAKSGALVRAPVTAEGTYSVRTLRLSLREPAGAGLAKRTVPTQIWAPVPPAAAAPQRKAPQRYPLVVFSPGYDLSVGAYRGLLAAWASAGLVVAAPTYPHTGPGDPPALDEGDIVNHPRDLRFVIASVVALAHRPHSGLFGLVDGSEVGIAGHSDGGDVALGVGYNSCCRDSLVRAVAVLSGAELASFGGSYFAVPSPPLLVIQGNEDSINLPVCSSQIYDSAKGAKFYLNLLGAGHEPPYAGPQTGPKQDREIVTKATIDFFEAELAGEHAAVAALSSVGNVPGVATIRAGGTGPPEPGSCPGAPA